MDSIRELLQTIADNMSSAEAKAFLEAIQSLKDSVDYAALLEALEAQDIEAAVRAMNIEPAAFSGVRAVYSEAYYKAGSLVAQHFPAPPESGVAIRFDLSNPRAEDQLRSYGAQKMVDLSEEQKSVIREALVQAYTRGEGPDNMIVGLVGRLNRQTGKRSGGVLGLTRLQLSYVDNMIRRMSSTDPAELRKILDMGLRDKRYDRYVKKAMKTGEPVNPAKLAEAVNLYESRLLAHRARLVGRTEVGMAVMTARMEAWRQGLDKTGYPEEAVVRRWKHGSGGEDPRPQHVSMHNNEVAGLTEPFVMPDGTRMLHAMDPAGGARHCANCTCDTEFEIDYSYGVT